MFTELESFLMIKLPNITLVCIDCLNYKSAINAINKSVEKIDFGKVLLLSDKAFYSDRFETVIIDKITSKEQYSFFMLKQLYSYIKTNFCLVIQYDGYVINPELWNEDWLNYDYIGAPWWYDSKNVGNGGFSLRSKKLLWACRDFRPTNPEDDFICRQIDHYLSKGYEIKYAPEEIAAKFSFEPNQKYPVFKNDTFGFHGVPKLIL